MMLEKHDSVRVIGVRAYAHSYEAETSNHKTPLYTSLSIWQRVTVTPGRIVLLLRLEQRKQRVTSES